MSSFKKTNVSVYAKPEAELTPDNIYWKGFSAPVLVKEFGAIDHIDFSPVEPHYFAVTCSVRVQVYNPITKLVVKNLSRFRESAYGASFRSDGKLLCAGGEEKVVKLFEVNSKTLLRLFKGHEAAVHRTYFTKDKTKIASFSDDKCVKLWDIATESNIFSCQEHGDYVRAGAVSPVSSEILLSGSYDRTVKMYDTRTNAVAFSVDHEAPVESVLFLPSGGVFLSAGGTEIRVWDAFAGGRLLARLSQHHKTITCLRLAQDNKRLLSAGLDRHVKVYDVATYKTVHTLDYPNAILSMAVSKDDETVVVGMVDGLISISRREEAKTPARVKRKVHYRYISDTHTQNVSETIAYEDKDKLSKHDQCLRNFQYTKALDCVLMPYVVNKTPQVTVSVMQELMRRRGLEQAMAGRQTKSILSILRFFVKHIGDNRFARVLIAAVSVFLTVYEESLASLGTEVVKMFMKLAEKLDEETRLSERMCEIEGALHMLLAVGEVDDVEDVVVGALVPSENARQSLVINV